MSDATKIADLKVANAGLRQELADREDAAVWLISRMESLVYELEAERKWPFLVGKRSEVENV